MFAAVNVPNAVVLSAGMVAAGTDLWKHKVHNVVTIPLLISGMFYHLYTEGVSGLGESLTGVVFGFGVFALPYLLGGMGAGDVKLMAGVGAWWGVGPAFNVFIVSSLAAGVYALALLAFFGGTEKLLTRLKIVIYQLRALRAYLAPVERVETTIERGDRRRLIPFAAMIALGIWATIVWCYYK